MRFSFKNFPLLFSFTFHCELSRKNVVSYFLSCEYQSTSLVDLKCVGTCSNCFYGWFLILRYICDDFLGRAGFICWNLTHDLFSTFVCFYKMVETQFDKNILRFDNGLKCLICCLTYVNVDQDLHETLPTLIQNIKYSIKLHFSVDMMYNVDVLLNIPLL